MTEALLLTPYEVAVRSSVLFDIISQRATASSSADDAAERVPVATRSDSVVRESTTSRGTREIVHTYDREHLDERFDDFAEFVGRYRVDAPATFASS